MTSRNRFIPPHATHLLAASSLLALLGIVSAGSAGTPRSAAPPVEASDPWSRVQLMRPAELAGLLKSPKGEKPLLLHVGFRALYRGGAIPGSRYVGPGSTAAGIVSLKAATKDLPRDRSIVLYCGCCPWDHCPNMRPAFRVLAEMGFKNVRALYITKNLESDWANPGYPIEKPKD